MGLLRKSADERAESYRAKAGREFERGDRRLRRGDEKGASKHYGKAVGHQMSAANQYDTGED